MVLSSVIHHKCIHFLYNHRVFRHFRTYDSVQNGKKRSTTCDIIKKIICWEKMKRMNFESKWRNLINESAGSDLYLDGIVTLVDSKYCITQLAESRPEGAVNECVQQIATADVVILNKGRGFIFVSFISFIFLSSIHPSILNS